MPALLDILDDLFAKLLPMPPSRHSLFAAMRYSVLNGGKRLRPTLVYCTGQVLGNDLARLHGAALSVELIHCYSLIHDDLPAMDDDDLRRGIASCHKAFDEATAILAGDALQSMAFQVLSDPELNPVSAERQIAMVRILAKAAGAAGMVLGQAEDMAGESRTLPLADLITLHKNKTGALFNACIELAILASEEQPTIATIDRLLTYGRHLGLAFQIQDDVLDVIGTDESLGKPAGSDQKLHKSTFTSLLGLEAAQQQATENFAKALEALRPIGQMAQPLVDLLDMIKQRSN